MAMLAVLRPRTLSVPRYLPACPQWHRVNAVPFPHGDGRPVSAWNQPFSPWIRKWQPAFSVSVNPGKRRR
eukprot:178030-Chlamydomonas_euryale.AAC.5